jgi:hypothetical protein
VYAIDESNYEYGVCPLPLNKANPHVHTYLGYSSLVNGPLIYDVTIVQGHVPQGYHVLDEEILKSGGVQAYIAYTTSATGGGGGGEDEIKLLGSVKPGEYLDARDTQPVWCVAQLISRQGNVFYVHYTDWNAKFDEKIDVRSGRIAP